MADKETGNPATLSSEKNSPPYMTSAPASHKEALFFDALRNVFVGAEVEGDSGYINLMRIKSKYYKDGVFPRLRKDIEEALKEFPDFREELFDKLYTFFKRYFSETGSIYFHHTPYHQNVYERVYTDDRDVMLFWKTHMLYYVKTDRLFKSMDVELDGFKFLFDVSNLEHKKANEKRELVYQFKERRGDGALVFNVFYSEKGRKTPTDDILKEIKKAGVAIGEEMLERAFKVFERQSEVDYFINKNARAFLREQFDLWLYQYVFSGESQWTEQRIKQLQALKEIAYKIIDFISQFEDELVRVWNKPKFVLNSNYVITLDHIAGRDPSLLGRLLEHPNFQAQAKEWQELGMVGQDFQRDQLFVLELSGKTLNPMYRYLPVDTRHFKEMELEILGLFDNLDDSLDGWLIKSENYQALNTLLPKFTEKVKTIYIDPPFNSKHSEISYQNNYKHSSWLSLMENRIQKSKDLLGRDGIYIVAVDENEDEVLGLLLRSLFPQHDITCVTIIHNPGGIQGDNFSYTHEYAHFVYPKEGVYIGKVEREKGNTVPLRDWGGNASRRETARNCFYPICVKDGKIIGFGAVCEDDYHPDRANIEKPDGVIEVYPIDQHGVERKWRHARQSVDVIEDDLICEEVNGEFVIHRLKSTYRYKTVWTEAKYNSNTYGSKLLNNILGSNLFDFPKSVHSVKECLHATTQNRKDAIILDFFAGSGTTGHAVINLNREDGGRRKYIMVEMADYFDTVLLPRIKKVVFSDKWKDGKAQNGQGISHFVKYYRFEQYEDALRRARYQDSDLFDNPYQGPYGQYVFLRDLKMLEALEVDVQSNGVKVDLSKLYPNIDLAETISNLKGKWIKRITPDYVELEDGEKVDLNNLDYKLIKPLIWW